MRLSTLISTIVLALPGAILAAQPINNLQQSYQFLTTDTKTGGALYTGSAGELANRQLPLSYADSAAFWGEYVCHLYDEGCKVLDYFNPYDYSVKPEAGVAGDLQIERIDVHNGTDIYDAATWQIGVMLGHSGNGFQTAAGVDPYDLVTNENILLQKSYDGNAPDSEDYPVKDYANRGITDGSTFVYNGHTVSDPWQAYSFRMITRSWLSTDPLSEDPNYQDLIQGKDIPTDNPDYTLGKVSWLDWKPITGENAWAFLVGPLQAAYLLYITEQHKTFVPFQDPAIQNAINVLPTFAKMQSKSGGIDYVPSGTLGNQGDTAVDEHTVSVENNFSLYGGLVVLQKTLEQTLANESLTDTQKREINQALETINTMLNGKEGMTRGLVKFFKEEAWDAKDGIFIQGGLADKNGIEWQPVGAEEPKAVDVNTWGVAALGPETVDGWHGFGTSYRIWQNVKKWGAYGKGKEIWGVGYSDQDGNGIDADGNYRQGILSAEWTAGAINMLNTMIDYYQTVGIPEAQQFVASLQIDVDQMTKNVQKLRFDQYSTADFPEGIDNLQSMMSHEQSQPYLYASKRYMIPFGWYANPLPSTCSTAWMIMIDNHFNPFAYGGGK